MKIYTTDAVVLNYTDCNSGQSTGSECTSIGDCNDCSMDDDC